MRRRKENERNDFYLQKLYFHVFLLLPITRKRVGGFAGYDKKVVGNLFTFNMNK